MKLTIVIPAYNEENAIQMICDRTIASKTSICTETLVKHVNIVVVSDGSWDKTAEIAGEIEGITLISYEKNKGYGAAIKMGFEKFDADLVSFLDADGTCDPLFFIPLINELIYKNLDVVLGSRINENSQMPAVRRFGNFLFAKLINTLAGSKVKDTASGMRVIRKDALHKLYPLPDGLHFTPAMSAKAIFNKTIGIGEIPMSYQERIGESKLSPLKDGIRFLRVILETAVQYAPHLFFSAVGITMLLLATILSVTPFINWIGGVAIETWMVYRILTAFVLFNAGLLMFSSGQVAKSFIRIIHYRSSMEIMKEEKRIFEKIIVQHGLLIGLLLLTVSAIVLYNPFIELISTGELTVNWIRFLIGELFFSLAIIFIAMGGLGIVQSLLSTSVIENSRILKK